MRRKANLLTTTTTGDATSDANPILALYQPQLEVEVQFCIQQESVYLLS